MGGAKWRSRCLPVDVWDDHERAAQTRFLSGREEQAMEIGERILDPVADGCIRKAAKRLARDLHDTALSLSPKTELDAHHALILQSQ